VFAGTLRHVYQDFVFTNNETLHVTPFLMPANTDTKKYVDLTKNIYRFNPARLDIHTKWGIHSIDEHVPFSAVLESTAFIFEYVLNANSAKDE
jgi:Gly-Xaa carboxypeptidase